MLTKPRVAALRGYPGSSARNDATQPQRGCVIVLEGSPKIPKNMFLSKPAWYLALPPHLRPYKGKIKLLETFRCTLELPDHEVFAMMISCSRWAAIKTQELSRDQLRKDLPHYSERELWRAVIVARLGAKVQLETNKMFMGIDDNGSTEALFEKMDSMDEVMAGIDSWHDVINYILELDIV